MEFWKTIEKYPQYEVSTFGRVKSHWFKKERILKGSINSRRGYVTVNLFRKGLNERLYVHRLVLEAFQPKHKSRSYVNHIDCNPTNNRLQNLEWVTQSENMKHAVSLGRININHDTRKRKVLRNDGRTYTSITEAARDIGCTRPAIWNVCNGAKHLVKGYSFSYIK